MIKKIEYAINNAMKKLQKGLYVHIKGGYFYQEKNGEYILRTDNGGKIRMSESVVYNLLLKDMSK